MTQDRPSRHLLILRHAKSDWNHPGLADHDRPLAPRGRRALAALRDHLEARDVPVDVVLCSSALRAVQTLEGIRPVLPADAEVHIEPDLYGAGASQLLARIRQVPAPTQGVLLVGHNPGMHDLAAGLAGRGDPEALAALGTKFPTAALAHLRVADWPSLTWADGQLSGLFTPAATRR